MEKKFHLKGLNGLRAIAATAVVFSHTLHGNFGIKLTNNDTGKALAGFGVTIFFSLSGFLITYLLLLEKEAYGTIKIKSFYIRRMLRIWPVYYLYLLIAVAITLLFNIERLPGSLGYYFFLVANIPFIAGSPLVLLLHYWSLGVEEQFYLFWPFFVKKTNQFLLSLIIFISVFIIIKIILRIIYAKTGLAWPYDAVNITRFDCMAIGALGAALSFKKYLWFREIVFHPVFQLAAWLTITLITFNKFHFFSVIDGDIVAAMTVVLIMNVSANPKSIVSLDYPIFNFLGKISYGVYVYHPVIIFFILRIFGSFIKVADTLTQFLFFLIVFFVTVIIAWLSYEFFEKRFLIAKKKFTLVESFS